VAKPSTARFAFAVAPNLVAATLSRSPSPQGAPHEQAGRFKSWGAARKRAPPRPPRRPRPISRRGGGFPGASRTGGCAITRLLPAPDLAASATAVLVPLGPSQRTSHRPERHQMAPQNATPQQSAGTTGRLSGKGIQPNRVGGSAQQPAMARTAPRRAPPRPAAQTAGASPFSCPAHGNPAGWTAPKAAPTPQPEAGVASSTGRLSPARVAARTATGVEPHQPGAGPYAMALVRTLTID